MKSIGERMAYARKQKMLNQQVLADHLGVTRGSISQYENGIIDPNLNNLDVAAKLLDVSFEWLAFGRGLQNRNTASVNLEDLAKEDERLVYLTAEERRLLERYQKLSRKLQSSVSNVLECMEKSHRDDKNKK